MKLQIMLSELRVNILMPNGNWMICPVRDSPYAIYFETNDPGVVLSYNQRLRDYCAYDWRTQPTPEGLMALKESVKASYDFRGTKKFQVSQHNPIVIQNGHHRAAILWHLHSDIGCVFEDYFLTKLIWD